MSPWVVHYTTSQPSLVTHNLIVGIAIGLLALGFTQTPERMYGLSWAMWSARVAGPAVRVLRTSGHPASAR